MPKRISKRSRYLQRKRYYKKHALDKTRSHVVYAGWEEDLIIDHKFSDVELSKILKRSVLGIQVKRNRIKGSS